jgi:anti-anti-sigma factor
MEALIPDRLGVCLQGQAPTMTIKLRGELTLTDGGAVVEAYRQASAQGAKNIVIDFADVELMNSAGIAQIVEILTQTRKAGQRLAFAGLSPHYRRIMTMMGLTRYASVHDTVADACKALESDG